MFTYPGIQNKFLKYYCLPDGDKCISFQSHVRICKQTGFVFFSLSFHRMFAGSVFPPSENPTFSCPSLNCATTVVVYYIQVPPTITSPPCNTQELLCAYQYLLLRQTCLSCLQRNKNEARINLEKIAFSYNITTFL